MAQKPAVLFIYQHGYQRRYYQQLCASNAFRGLNPRLAFYWALRWPAAGAPKLLTAEVDSITGFQQHKRQLRGQKPLTTLLRWRSRWDYRCWYRVFQLKKPSVIACWNGNNPGYRAARLAAERLGIPCFVFENGPLPNSTTCDPQGVNARNSLTRDANFYRGYASKIKNTALDSTIAVRLSEMPMPDEIRLPERYIFAPFQVHEDTQLLAYSPAIPDMPTFFTWLSQAADALGITIVVKQHPSCKQRYSLQHPGILFADGNSTEQLIRESDAVVTINSTVGLEAIMLGKPVITLGAAYYNLPGLTLTANTETQLVEQLKNVKNWPDDEPLRRGFIHYLRQHYLLPGDWRDASEQHCMAVKQRLTAIR